VIPFHAVLWDDPKDPDGNVQHIAEHDLTPAEVESVLRNPNGKDERSRTTGRHVRFGWTSTNKYIMVAYEIKQGRTLTAIRPKTAYEVDQF
jgi:hypothetical protein